MSLHPDTIKRGMRCNWKGQPERLIYLRKFNGWHQFQKIGDSRPVWCEVLDADLHMLEETKDDDALQPCGHPKSLALQSAESGEPLYCEACDDKSGRRDAELRESELAAANVALRERIAGLEAQRQWLPIETAPRQRRFLALVDGLVRFVAWGKTSHVPMYGWCLVDQGAEDSELCEPTHWMPLPPLPVERAHGIEEVKR